MYSGMECNALKLRSDCPASLNATQYKVKVGGGDNQGGNWLIRAIPLAMRENSVQFV